MQLSHEQIRAAAAAAHEVLSGADPQRTLALMEQLVIAKQILAMLAAGQLIVGRPAAGDQPPASAGKGKRKVN